MGTDRNRDSMLARTWVVLIGWTLTAVRESIIDRHEALVLGGILMARVADEHILFDERELEGFVLSTVDRSIRQLEAVKQVR